jgi:phage gpG-like protein
MGPLLKQIGALMAGKAKKAFSAQRRGTKRWLPRGGRTKRQVKNLFGLLLDLSRGKTPAGRRFDARPAGIDTGTLRRSIAFQVDSERSVKIGSSSRYANKFQQGGTSAITIDEAVKQSLSRFLRRRPDLREELGWLFQEDSYEIKTPARPFLVMESADVVEISRLVEAFFVSLGGGRGARRRA